MKDFNVPIQSLIDHIKTATDVDPWAKEMAEELLKEQEHKDKMFHALEEDWKKLKEQEEHKIGKWEVKPSNKEQGERDFIWWKCSECGQVIYSESEHDREEFHKYCGRCGAKMT